MAEQGRKGPARTTGRRRAHVAQLHPDDIREIRRGATIIDRALAAARAAASHPISLRQIAMQCRLNPAMITRLAAIGRVVATLPSYRITRLRQHEAMTWKAIQRIATRGRNDADIIADLEAIVARGIVDRRKGKRANRPTRATDPASMLGTLAWLDDPAAAGDDPLILMRAYRVHLREVHDRVGQRLRSIVAQRQTAAAGIPFAGQSLRAIVAAARTARRVPPSAEATEAMRLYTEIGEGLSEIVRRR